MVQFIQSQSKTLVAFFMIGIVGGFLTFTACKKSTDTSPRFKLTLPSDNNLTAYTDTAFIKPVGDLTKIVQGSTIYLKVKEGLIITTITNATLSADKKSAMVTMDSDKTITASYADAPVVLTLTQSIGGIIKAYTDAGHTQEIKGATLTQIVKGTKIYLTTTPMPTLKNEIEVYSVSINGTATTPIPAEVVMDGNKTITAIFATKGNLFVVSGKDIVKYTGTDTLVLVPAIISGTAIEIVSGSIVSGTHQGAFESNTTLKHVNIPDAIVGIGTSTFKGCSQLISIVIGSGVTSISNTAFQNCSSLNSVTMKPINPPILQDNVFQDAGTGVAGGFKIYVPTAYFTTYKNVPATRGWDAELKSKITEITP